MDIAYQLQGMEFERDADKAQSNIDKHSVSFEEAAEAFLDPFYQIGDASTDTDQEQRDFLIGYSSASRLLLVVHTARGQRTRIISARPATRAERQQYEEA